MSVPTISSERTPPTPRWRLWIDGCGGYLLLPGNRWTVGGIDPQSAPDVCVRADWPRRAGVIDRDGADYFWQSESSTDVSDTTRQLIISTQVIPISGSAQMTLDCPSPLSSSATLSLRGQHRFDGHVDSVILVNETLLIGPSRDCHIQSIDFPDRSVLVCRAGRWQAKIDTQSDFHQLVPGKRITLQSLAMTLEEA